MKILIGPSTFGSLDNTTLAKLASAGFEVINNPYGRKLTREELLKLLPGVTGLIAGLELLDREVLERSNLKVISRCGSGLSNVDLKAAQDLGIKVYSTPDAPVEAVAELTLAALLGLLRMLPNMDRDLHDGKWNKKIGTQLMGKTVVIVGFGRIGRRVASLLKPFKVRIIAVDRQSVEGVRGVKFLSLRDALGQADIISIHSNGNEQIIGKNEFEFMKKKIFLLNAGRGKLVDEEALIEALEENKVVGAWLDVFSAEPYLGPLKKYPQVILTPHVGSYTVECRRQMEMESVDNLIIGLSQLKSME